MRGGDSGPGAGFGGDSGPGTECAGIQAWARGGDLGPGAECAGIRAPSAGWELFGVRWEIFYLFAVFSPFG